MTSAISPPTIICSSAWQARSDGARDLIRQGRLVDKAGQFPRDEHASKWAGFLAHYLQDNTQPQHATEDYRSASYFSANPRSAPNVHADVEYRLVDDEFEDYPALRAEFFDISGVHP